MRYGIVKRTALLATLIATGFSGLACKGPLDGLDPVGIETEFDGTDSEKTVYNPNFLWSVSYNNTIPACFVNGETPRCPHEHPRERSARTHDRKLRCQLPHAQQWDGYPQSFGSERHGHPDDQHALF